MKKSLIFWFAAVTCAALFLVGCESPTNGESGAAGTDGPYPLTDATVSAAQLEAAFYVSSRVAITNGSGGIDGEVPAGKTLYVLGSAAKVASGESLTVKGTLDIYEAAALNASYVSGTAGYLATSGGAITGTGIVSLPYLAAGVTDGPTGIVTYGNSPGGITKTAGSYIAVSAASPGSALDNAGLVTLMGDLPAGGSLTVSDIDELTAAAVPAGKTLTLVGDDNTVKAALDLAAGGTLIVDGTLTDSTGVAITASGTTSNITINGTLALAVGSTVAGMLTNNGTITTSSMTNTVVAGLLGLDGGGTVESSGVVSAAFDAAAALKQDVVIKSGGTLKAFVATSSVTAPFSGGKTITIESGGTLDLGAADAALSLSGVNIENNGTITTATTSDAALGVIMGAGGAITSTGDVTSTVAFTVPAGTALTKSSGTFVGGSGELIINGQATFTTGTFASQTGAVTINGTASFGAAAVPLGDVTVAGTLTVANSASLTIAAGKTLANAGTVALTGTGSLVLTSAATTSGNHAKLTGTGTLTAQDTEISGGTGGWEAVPSDDHAQTVTIASTATAGQATITGSTNESATASLKGGAGATITQKVGTENNALTLTTVTLDLSANGSLTLEGANTNGASVVLVDATAIIKGAGTSGSVTTAKITAIGSVAIANLTIGGSLVFTDNTSGNVFEAIKGAGSGNSLTAKVDGTDLTVDKNTTLAFTT